MFQVRIHGRGGQGVVTAAELLSVAAFLEGKHAQAFPSFGSERTGSPVVSFYQAARADPRARRLDRPGSDAVQGNRHLPAICDLQGDFQKLQGEPILLAVKFSNGFNGLE